MTINIGVGRKTEKKKSGFLDKAVIYCLFMCTVLDAAVLVLYWHSAQAPDSLAIAAMAVPWTVEFGAMASIKNNKGSKPTSQEPEEAETVTETEEKGE